MLKTAFLQLALLTFFSPLPNVFLENARAGFCDRLVAQMGGYDVFGGNAEVIDRETLGDVAIDAGIRYLAISVPISELPDILLSAYLPRENYPAKKPQLLEPVGVSKVGADISATLGGIDLTSKAGHGVVMTSAPHQNALILYSPRVLSLIPWTYANSSALAPKRAPGFWFDSPEPGQLCGGWSCVTSNSSDSQRRRAFQRMNEARDESWVLRLDSPIPRYEILAVVIQPENQSLVEALWQSYPGLGNWKKRFLVSSEYPALDPTKHRYSPRDLYEVALDISPSVRSWNPAQTEIDTFTLTTAVTRFTPSFPKTIRTAVSQQVFLHLDRILCPENPTYGWQGYSDAEIEKLTQMEAVLAEGGTTDGNTVRKILPGAKLHRMGNISVQAVRDWNFTLAEYQGQNQKARLVLFFRPNHRDTRLADVPYNVWGIGRYSGDGIVWEWTPDRK